MTVRKNVEPKVTDITMSDIKQLINDKFTDSDKYSKLQFDTIKFQLKLVTTDVANLRTEVKDIGDKLVIMDKEEALHYLSCPNTILSPEIKNIIKEFPEIKNDYSENKWIKKYAKPLSIGYGVLTLMFIAGLITAFVKFSDAITYIRSNATDMQDMKAYIETLKQRDILDMNGNPIK